MPRAYNFSAGPAILPTSVLETARDELLDYQGSGTSIMEMSHRGGIFQGVYEESINLLREVANVPDNFDILYMTGGASGQFAYIPMNLSGPGRSAGYVNTGSWSEKAIKQAKLLDVKVHDAGSSAPDHKTIPTQLNLTGGLDYIHLTSNNTIFGTQFHSLPDPGDTKLVIDMSSDFLSKPIDWSKIGMAYAGTQKNAGPSGLTVVVIDRSYYARENEKTPTVLRYSTYGENESMYNTPPTFQIYLFGLILKWIKNDMGGLTGVAKHNEAKAKLVYDVIDEFSDFYIGHAEKSARSLMNVTWNFANNDLVKPFLAKAEEKMMPGLKGHRSVGGLRASIYNAMPQEGCKALADFMREFAKANG